MIKKSAVGPTYAARMLEILEPHQGIKNAISKDKIKIAIGIKDERKCRLVIEWLREHNPRGAFICSTLAGGYYMARDQAELVIYADTERRRALTILGKIKVQLLRAFPELAGQDSYIVSETVDLSGYGIPKPVKMETYQEALTLNAIEREKIIKTAVRVESAKLEQQILFGTGPTQGKGWLPKRAR
jgi:hypothetical protein